MFKPRPRGQPAILRKQNESRLPARGTSGARRRVAYGLARVTGETAPAVATVPASLNGLPRAIRALAAISALFAFHIKGRDPGGRRARREAVSRYPPIHYLPVRCGCGRRQRVMVSHAEREVRRGGGESTDLPFRLRVSNEKDQLCKLKLPRKYK